MSINILYCDQSSEQNFPQHLSTDICSITAVKWEITAVACFLLTAVGAYILKKWKYRCHKTLLTFHNLRAAVALLLLSINTLELARACLPTTTKIAATATPTAIPLTVVAKELNNNGENMQNNGYGETESNLQYPVPSAEANGQEEAEMLNDRQIAVLVIGISLIWNAFIAILFTITLMCYHRIVELKKLTEFLYVSSTLEAIIFILRIYELAEIVYERFLFELEPSLQASTALCLLSLAIIDGFTIYKERYRPDYLEDYEKIGYKHTLATFYSKACFFWLSPLLWFGYKEPLELEDLGQMRVEDSARAHYDQFLLIYKTAKVKNSDRPPSLWLCYFKCCWRMFTLGGLFKLFGDLFSLIGPLAIQQIVKYIEIMYETHIPKHNVSNRNELPQMNNINDFNTSNSNNNNSSITLKGLRGQLNNSLITASNKNIRRLLNYLVLAITNENKIGVNMQYGIIGKSNEGISIRETGKDWFQNSLTDDYYYDYGDDDDDVSSVADVAAAAIDVQIYYPTWLDLLSNGWAIAWIVLLAALAQGALSQASTHMLNITGIRIKTSLQGLIYRKTLLLNASCIDPCSDVSGRCEVSYGDAERNSSTNTLEIENKENLTDDDVNNGNENERNYRKRINGNRSQKNNQVDKGMDSDSNNVGAITNLMSEDTLNIMSFFWIAHYVWAIPLKIGVVMYLLYNLLGVSAVIGSFVCILTMTPLQFLIGKAMSNNTETMAQFTDERLKRIHETFIGIKLIKLNAWDDVFLRKIGEARARELKYLNKDSIYWTLMTILTHISTVLITFVTLAVYTSLERDSNEFAASHLFSALALFQQLTVPLLIFPITVPIIISAVISTRRLERFLYASEIQKQFEGIRNMARILSKSDASLDMYEIKDKSASLPANVSIGDGQQQQQMQQQNKLNERIALKINVPGAPAPLAHSEPHTPLSLYEVNTSTGFNFQLTNDENNKSALSVDALQSYKWHETREKRLSVQRRELLRNTPYVVIRPRKTGHNIAHTPHMPLSKKYSDSFSHRESLLLKMPDDMAVSVKQATFAWNPQRMEHVLHIKDISIPKGRLTMILGKNGSGKSSLLAALLMEMPLVSGDMIWNKTSTIAYVPQQPWLLNASIRDNILFGESFRPKRYDFVLEACALKPDIELMPNGDLTVIGERGINLSGGQRQRVAIARALYSSANVVIMDDPLSSLDNEVARHIFEQSIKKMLLKANRTVLLVTQQLQLVQQTDYLIVMKDGRLQASGTYKEIEMNHPHIITKWNSIIAKVNEQLREQENEHNQLGRTARERWKLFKNVTRIGLQRSISASAASASAPKTQMASEYGVGGITSFQLNGTNGNGILDDEDDVLPATSSTHNPLRMSQSLGNFSLTRKRSSVYGSRHLIYDVPLPIDECQTEDIIMRRGRRRGTSQRLSMQQKQHERHQKHEISQEYQNQQQLQQQYQQQQQRPDSLRTSWNSSRFSGISNASTELPHSLLTASYSSATSCDSNNSNTNASCMTILDSINNDGYEQQKFERQQRVQSWQPQSSSMPIHAPVKRNVSSPSSLPTATNSSSPSQNSNGSIVQDTYENSEDNNDVDETTNEANKTSDADLVADIVKSSKVDGGFQQFLQRMSMRRSNKPTVSTVHRIHLPVSATNSILSISEETSTTPTTPISPVPAAELSFQAMAAEFNASGEIDNESHFDDRCISNKLPELQPMAATLGDCKILVNNANTCHNVTENLSAAVIYACKNTKPSTMNDPMQTANDSGENVDSLNVIKTITTTEKTHKATAKERVTPQQTIMMTASKSPPTSTPLLPMSTDVERKYGKISTQIYLLYLRASGFSIVLIFFISALIWQGLRIYTDIWLQHWTDDSIVSGNLKNFKTISPTPASSNVSFLLTTMLLSSTSSPSYMPSAHHEVTYYFRVYTIISCVCILMAMISTPAGQLAGCNARRHLHDKLLKTIMRKSLHFFQVTPLGRIMNRFSYDMAIIDKKIAATSQRLLQFTLLCLCAILINVSITPWFILLTLPICGAYYAIQKFYRSSSRELQRIENATNSPVISHLTETIQGVTTIRAYNQEARFTEILFKRLEANTIAFTILNTSNRWLGISLDYLGGIIVFVAILTALVTANITCKKWENYDDNKNNSTATATPSPSLVGLAINYTLLVPIYLNWVVKLLADMEMYIGSVERIAYYADSDLQKTSKTIRVTHDEIIKTDNGEEENDSDDAVANVCLRRTNQATKTSVYQNKLNSSGRNSIANATKSLAVVNEKLADADTSRIVIERTDAERCTSLRRLSNFGKHYKSVPISWPKRGDISFENVSLRYEGQQEDIIKNLTLKIPAGQKVGICGRTGSGKSSLALSLFGVLQTTSGRICIDDVDITQIHPDEIRTRLSIIPQDVHLFSATIRENLDPAGYYADLALWNCLEMAQLKEFVNAQMPMGLDTEITDGGRNLSAGHRQLFCLARAILRGSVCLVLDEATSSLDSSTEKALLATAHKAFKGRTILTIAHRLSTILDYDRIIVLEYGKIVEDGKPQELQRKPNGVFGALLQSGRPLSATLSESGVVLQELIQHNPNQ